MLVDQMLDEARRRAELDSFGSDCFLEGLEILGRHIETSRNLNAVGQKSLLEICIANLVNRLRVTDWVRSHPAVLSSSVERPIFILGAPRTGTTLVSNLLAVDPSRRSLLRWEATDSVPPPKKDALRNDSRCIAMKAADASALLSQTTSSSIHHEEADGPTECVVLLAQDFKSMMFEAMAGCPAYSDWILNTDMTSAYDYHSVVLQVLQSETGGTWALKMPSHAVFIRCLLKIYPDARIIWTHRDPYKAIASLCSLIANLRGKFGDVDIHGIGPTYIEHFMAHLQRPMELHTEAGPKAICNVQYIDMVQNPIAEMRRIYEWLGDPFTPSLEAAMEHWLTANPQGRFGRHLYGLEQFGLTEVMLQPFFADYIARYHVPIEGQMERV